MAIRDMTDMFHNRLFLIFVHILCDIDFLQVLRQNSSSQILQSEPAMFTDDNDLDLCLYYLQAFSNVLKYSGEVSRTVLATKHVTINGQHIQISSKFYVKGVHVNPGEYALTPVNLC
jgi:hypothetical protein